MTIMFWLAPEVWTALLVILLPPCLFYVFYPAISMKWQDDVGVDVEVVSPETTIQSGDADVLFSFVIPAYNEEERLPKMLDATLAFLKENRGKLITHCQQRTNNSKATVVEWIIVSDGSTDKTDSVVREYAKTSKDVWKLLTLHQNSGKGYAVKQGMLKASGAMRLMVDADGATDMKGLLLLLEEEHEHYIVFGSRAQNELLNPIQRTMIRSILMHVFHFFVHVLCSSRVKDTQCGFKLFTAQAANDLFSPLHLKRWAFDIELVIVAQQLNYDIKEVSVTWEEVEGSKLDTSKMHLALASLGMLRDMICVRLCYELGIWKTKNGKK